MAGLELSPGTEPAQALKAFETILAELEKVKPLNYRSSLFTRWKQIVQAALTRFLGPDHEHTSAFSALVFHGPMPKSPMDPPVSDKDKAAYEASVTKTAGILCAIILALKPPVVPDLPPGIGAAPTPEPAALKSPPDAAFPAPPTPDPGFKLVFKPSDTVAKFAQAAPPPPPVEGAEIRSTHDLPRHANTAIPAGGLKIVSRSGTSLPANTLEQFIEACEDPQQQALLAAVKQAVDDPNCTWATVRNSLAELWWASRDTVQKILPLILRR
jgi:hypothetical protein